VICSYLLYSIIALLQGDRGDCSTRTIDTQDQAALQYCFDLADFELGSDVAWNVDDEAEVDECLMYCGDCSDTASSVDSDAPVSCASLDSAETGMVANETAKQVRNMIHTFFYWCVYL